MQIANVIARYCHTDFVSRDFRSLTLYSDDYSRSINAEIVEHMVDVLSQASTTPYKTLKSRRFLFGTFSKPEKNRQQSVDSDPDRTAYDYEDSDDLYPPITDSLSIANTNII